MAVKSTEIKTLDELYAKTGNQLVIYYGKKESEKEELLKKFTEGKKFFYYRCRQASAAEQNRMLGEELAAHFDVRLQKHTYDEYFNRIKSGDPSKLVVVIDEAQYVIKKDPDFLKSIVKLRAKRLYPGPVLIILASSSTVWAEQEAEEMFGEDARRIDAFVKIEDMNFLEFVRRLPDYPVSECIRIYGVLGGVAGYMKHWDHTADFKTNICRLVLSPGGYLFGMAEAEIASELRELSVYDTILSAIAQGHNKLNDLYQTTGYSRAKISVYMKNLSRFDIVEKVVSFETGGWENAKKGVYQVKDTFINFWFKFVYPHLSDLYLLKPEEFYDRHIGGELDHYLNRYFRNVCMEYLALLNQMKRLPFEVHKMGTWVGKTGNIDIIAQSSTRENIIGLCNWEKPMLTVDMCEEMALTMEKARLSSNHYYLFSATAFEPALIGLTEHDPRFTLIDMKEL